MSTPRYARKIKKLTGKEAPTTMSKACNWLEDLNSEDDAASLIQDELEDGYTIQGILETHPGRDPSLFSIWFYGTHGIQRSSVLGLIWDRLQPQAPQRPSESKAKQVKVCPTCGHCPTCGRE